jgi:hypothetical protein
MNTNLLSFLVGPRPSSRSAFDKGIKAAGLELEKRDNPYPSGTEAHSDWEAGRQLGCEVDEATDIDNYS